MGSKNQLPIAPVLLANLQGACCMALWPFTRRVDQCRMKTGLILTGFGDKVYYLMHKHFVRTMTMFVCTSRLNADAIRSVLLVFEREIPMFFHELKYTFWVIECRIFMTRLFKWRMQKENRMSKRRKAKKMTRLKLNSKCGRAAQLKRKHFHPKEKRSKNPWTRKWRRRWI